MIDTAPPPHHGRPVPIQFGIAFLGKNSALLRWPIPAPSMAQSPGR